MRTIARRGWLGWAVGLAVVALALGGWGFLPRSSVVADEGGGEHQPRQEAPQIDILLVPEYLYADATAAVPVKFQFIDLGNTVEVQELQVKFVVDGAQKIFKDYSNRFAKDDGFGVVGNGDSDTYTVWVPISDFQFQVEDDLTDNCFFLVHAKARPKGETEDGNWYTSIYTDQDAQPEVFGDETVLVVEIGVAKDWKAIDPAHYQDHADSLPEVTNKHTGMGILGVGAFDECPLPDLPPYLPINGMAFPHTFQIEIGEQEESCTGYSGNLYYVNHYGAPHDQYQLGTTIITHAFFEDAPDFVYPPPDPYINYYFEFNNKSLDNTLGVIFGASYRPDSVPCLEGEKGMNIYDPQAASGNGHLWLFQGAQLSISIQGVTDPDTWDWEAAALLDALKIAWGLATQDGGMVLGGVVSGAKDVIKAAPDPGAGAVHVAAFPIWQQKKPDGSWKFPPTPLHVNLQWHENTSGFVPCPMSKDNLSIQVGHTYLFQMTLEALVRGESWYDDGLFGDGVDMSGRIAYLDGEKQFDENGVAHFEPIP